MKATNIAVNNNYLLINIEALSIKESQNFRTYEDSCLLVHESYKYPSTCPSGKYSIRNFRVL